MEIYGNITAGSKTCNELRADCTFQYLSSENIKFPVGKEIAPSTFDNSTSISLICRV